MDIELNHMSRKYDNAEKGTNGNRAFTTIKKYPGVPYDQSHFHNSCKLEDYNDLNQLQNCEVNGRQDLNQSHPFVRKRLKSLMNELINIGVTGFR